MDSKHKFGLATMLTWIFLLALVVVIAYFTGNADIKENKEGVAVEVMVNSNIYNLVSDRILFKKGLPTKREILRRKQCSHRRANSQR